MDVQILMQLIIIQAATQDDGSCITIIIGCTDSDYLEFDP